MTTPTWESVDNYTSDLLDLVANEQSAPVDREWTVFLNAITTLGKAHGVIRPNRLRPMVKHLVAPKRLGAFVNRALKAGLIEPDGWEISDDREGRNAGRPARTYRWLGQQD